MPANNCENPHAHEPLPGDVSSLDINRYLRFFRKKFGLDKNEGTDDEGKPKLDPKRFILPPDLFPIISPSKLKQGDTDPKPFDFTRRFFEEDDIFPKPTRADFPSLGEPFGLITDTPRLPFIPRRPIPTTQPRTGFSSLDRGLGLLGRVSPLDDDQRGFTVFKSQFDRLRVTLVANKLADYIEQNDVQNLVLVDRAARPAFHAVRAVWNQKHPGERLPFNVYFINPRGFLTHKDLTTDSKGVSRITEEMFKGILSEDKVDMPIGQRTSADIEGQLKAKYGKLVNAKDGTTLIYDNCVHKGDSINPIQRAFLALGFSDLRIGVASTEGNTSGITPDFVAIPDLKTPVCGVFGADRAVKKPFESVHSQVNARGIKQGGQLRREIRVAITDPFNGRCDTPAVTERDERDDKMIDFLLTSRRPTLSPTRFGLSDFPFRFGEERESRIPDTTLQTLKDYSVKDGNYPAVVEAYGGLQDLGLNTPRDAIRAITAGGVPKDLLEKIIDTNGGGISVAPAIISAARQALKSLNES